MRQFIGGILLGSVLTGSLGMAAGLYDQKGNLSAPRGSVQQSDYFRERAQRLDVEAMRRQADQRRLEHQANPCAK